MRRVKSRSDAADAKRFLLEDVKNFMTAETASGERTQCAFLCAGRREQRETHKKRLLGFLSLHL